MPQVSKETFVKHVLNQYNTILRGDFHTVLFLCEHEYYKRYGERITDAQYRDMLEVIGSAELDQVIQELEQEGVVDIEDRTHRSENFDLIHVHDPPSANVPSPVADVVNTVVDKFTDESPYDYAKALFSEDSTLTDVVDFGALFETPTSFLREDTATRLRDLH